MSTELIQINKTCSDFTRQVCVEVKVPYTLTGVWNTSSPTVVFADFQDSFGHTIRATFTVPTGTGAAVASAGARAVLGGNGPDYLVTASFDKAFSGRILLDVSEFGLFPTQERLCAFSLGGPDVLDNNSIYNLNCVEPSLLSAAATPKVFGWSEVDDLTSFTFRFIRSDQSGASFILPTLQLTSSRRETWLTNGNGQFVDPHGATVYNALPTGVFEVQCQEVPKMGTFQKEMCYFPADDISFFVSTPTALPASVPDLRYPRVDGVPNLTILPSPVNLYEFSPKGDHLAAVSFPNILRTFFTGNLTPATPAFNTLSLNYSYGAIAFLNGYPVVGFAIHPITGNYWLLHREPGGTGWMYLVEVTNTFTGDTRNWGYFEFDNPTPQANDAYDITFTKSGQLLFAFRDNIYNVNFSSNPQPLVTLDENSKRNFGSSAATGGAQILAQSISRYGNGDILISGINPSGGFGAVILDGETLDQKTLWLNGVGALNPIQPHQIAYTGSPNIPFTRVGWFNEETGGITKIDIDKDFNLIQTFAGTVTDQCPVQDKSYQIVEKCYVVDRQTVFAGTLEAANQLLSVSTCGTITGYVTPITTSYISLTKNSAGDRVYAYNATTSQVDVYNTTILSGPSFVNSLTLTGFVNIAETFVDIRTRWYDNSVWIMTELNTAGLRFLRWYTVNLSSGDLNFKGQLETDTTDYTTPSFTWGVDDELYVSGFRPSNVGTANQGIFKFDKLGFFNKETLITQVWHQTTSINTHVSSNRLMMISPFGFWTYYTYEGNYLTFCSGNASTGDVIDMISNPYVRGTEIQRASFKFTFDGNNNSQYVSIHDPITGQDKILPPNYRFVDCPELKKEEVPYQLVCVTPPTSPISLDFTYNIGPNNGDDTFPFNLLGITNITGNIGTLNYLWEAWSDNNPAIPQSPFVAPFIPSTAPDVILGNTPTLDISVLTTSIDSVPGAPIPHVQNNYARVTITDTGNNSTYVIWFYFVETGLAEGVSQYVSFDGGATFIPFGGPNGINHTQSFTYPDPGYTRFSAQMIKQRVGDKYVDRFFTIGNDPQEIYINSDAVIVSGTCTTTDNTVTIDGEVTIADKTARPRFVVITGASTWQKTINAPNAKSITFTRVTGSINVDDTSSGPQTVNFGPASFTWSADQLTNDIIFTGLTAGTRFTINWVE